MKDRLDKRINIQKRSIVKVKGIPTDKWDDYYSCQCTILDLIGREKYDAINVKLENSIKFKCRTCKKLIDIHFDEKEYQVIWNDKAFNIIFVDTLGGSNDWIILQAQATS